MSWSWACVGGLAWSASEYAIHRFIGHGPRRALPASLAARLTPRGFMAAFSAEHTAHHTNPTYFAPSSHKLVAALVAIPALTLVLSPLVGARRGASFGAGFAVTYLGYEIAHRRIHTHAPDGPYGRWMRKHHLHHHHKTPRDNHGVTSALWDHAFGTHRPPERVRVPRAVAPVWMVNPRTQAVRAGLEHDYELVGRHAPAAAPAVVAEPAPPAASQVQPAL